MQTTVNERVKILINALESGVPARFAKKLGVAASVIGNYLPGSSREGEPSFSVLQKIATIYPQVNMDWLVKGEGEMFKNAMPEAGKTVQEPEMTFRRQEREKELEIKPDPVFPIIKEFTNGAEKRHELQAIPLYDITAAAGLNALYNSKQNILDYLSIPNLARCDGAIYLKGDSMYPLLKHGDIVAFQLVSDFPEDIYFGEMYVVDMSTASREKIVVKYVQKSDKGDEYIKLVSYNEKHHPPKEVHLSKVRALAEVKASIRLS